MLKTSDPYRLVQDFKTLAQKQDGNAIATYYKKLHNEDILEILENLSRSEVAFCFRFLDKKRQPEIFGDLSFLHQNYLVRLLSIEESTKLLQTIPKDELNRFLHKVPRTRRLKLLEKIDEIAPGTMARWKSYPNDVMGHWMSDDYFTASPEWTIQETLVHLRNRNRDETHPLYSVMVIDEGNRLLDKLNLDEVASAEPDKKISDIMDSTVAYLYVDDPVEKGIERFQSRDTIVMPIVDHNERLMGVISADDIMHLAQDAVTEDMMKMGAVEATTEPYLQASVFEQFKKRGGWLLILFIGEMFTATAMGFFEEEISKAVVLALFLPLILSSGGNSGSQSSTLVIRAMALNEVRLGEWFKVFKREIIVGVLLGVLLGTVALIRIALWESLGWADYTEKGHFELLDVTFAVSIGIVGIVAWGNLVGALLPIGLRAVKLDPAAISAPFLATFVDVTGLIIYFSAAKAILNL